ncbi:MAG: hypothetical protein EU544_06330 [Promethearchaeota archaeon]|nr:MAG: hypothetical protein EU544_06330 [Candidatus Lokiarchaeota archaeon]
MEKKGVKIKPVIESEDYEERGKEIKYLVSIMKRIEYVESILIISKFGTPILYEKSEIKNEDKFNYDIASGYFTALNNFSSELFD